MFRRALSILLCGCLLAGSLPATGFAAEEQAVETAETAADNTGGVHKFARAVRGGSGGSVRK